MLEGFKALLSSEKAIAGGVLIICATVLAAIGMMAVSDWQSYTRDIFLVYVGGKTVQGAVSAIADAKKAPEVKVEQKTEAKVEAKEIIHAPA